MIAKAIRSLTPILGIVAICSSPAFAKHSKEVPTTNIFTPRADVVTAPTFTKAKTAPPRILDGVEEPRWDIVKSLPDLNPDQQKSLNKLQQETQKGLAALRLQMNEAQQEVKDLKANKTPAPRTNENPAITLLNPDGKPYMGPLLGTEEMGMDPSEETQEDLQAQIDGLKDKIKESNIKAANQAKTLLTQDQQNELDLMRQGLLVVKTPNNFLVDSPAEPSTTKSKNRHELASNAGARVLREILSGTTRGIRQQKQI